MNQKMQHKPMLTICKASMFSFKWNRHSRNAYYADDE